MRNSLRLDVAIFIVALLCAPLLLSMKLTHDVSWQYWVGRQMVHGVPLYERIIENNPPLWFWMSMPLVEMGEFFSIQPDRLHICAIILLSLWSVMVTSRFVIVNDGGKRFAMMAAMLAFFWVAPLYNFGQREQVTVILGLPYCALILKRQQGEAVHIGLALLIGVTAAAGFALKHYFALVPIGLELWLLWYSRRLLSMLRVETIILGLCAVLYVAYIVLFMPLYLEKIVPLVELTYSAYGKASLFQLLTVEVAVWALVLASVILMRRKVSLRDQRFGDILTIAGVAFAAAYFIQDKGWPYHAIPASVCFALLGFHYLTNQGKISKAILAYPAAFVAIVLYIAIGVVRGPYRSDWAGSMDAYFSLAHRGNSIMVLTWDPRRVFPFVEDYKLIWPSRHFSFWVLTAVAEAEHRGGLSKAPQLEQLAKQTRREALEDMKCHPPEIILSDIRQRTRWGFNFNMTLFFTRDPLFKMYLEKNYRMEKPPGDFEVYHRTTPMIASGKNCFPVY